MRCVGQELTLRKFCQPREEPGQDPLQEQVGLHLPLQDAHHSKVPGHTRMGLSGGGELDGFITILQ